MPVKIVRNPFRHGVFQHDARAGRDNRATYDCKYNHYVIAAWLASREHDGKASRCV